MSSGAGLWSSSDWLVVRGSLSIDVSAWFVTQSCHMEAGHLRDFLQKHLHICDSQVVAESMLLLFDNMEGIATQEGDHIEKKRNVVLR